MGSTSSVEKGQCFGLLGPNGAGKTTALKMIYGVTPPSAGRVLVFDQDITTHTREIRARLGVTLQENALIEVLSPVENLRVFGRYHLLPRARARGAHRRAARLPRPALARARAGEGALGRLPAPPRDRALADERARSC